jgi:hypothetical protein
MLGKSTASPTGETPQTHHQSPGDPARQLIVRIDDWFELNTKRLMRSASKIAKGGVLPEAISVTLDAPRFISLRDFVLSQSQRQSESEIKAQQLEAVDIAEKRLSTIEEWVVNILVNVSSRYGLDRAIMSCESFLRGCLAYSISNLATFQVLGEEPVCKKGEFTRWFDRNYQWQTLAQLAADRRELLEVVIWKDTDTRLKQSETIYIPPDFKNSPGPADLLIESEPAQQIPQHVWTGYVISQCAIKNVLGFSTYCPWIRQGVLFSSHGLVWSGTNAEDWSLRGIDR